MSTKNIKRLARNTVGRDLYVGDLHGCFSRLSHALREIGFNEFADRVICTGDLVDRGPHSAMALEWLSKPWFHAIKGNHEDMLVRFHWGHLSINDAVRNGGAWYTTMMRDERLAFADAFEALPVAIEVETEGLPIVVIHADMPGHDWGVVRSRLEAGDQTAILNALWSRDRAEDGDVFDIAGASRVVLGHTVVPHPISVGNMLYLDCGACFGGPLVLFEPNHRDGPCIHVETPAEACETAEDPF